MDLNEKFDRAFDASFDIETERKQRRERIASTVLDFSKINVDRSKMRVATIGRGRLRVAFDSSQVAFDFYNSLDPEEFEMMRFDEALLSYAPPEKLIKKSKNPLWVIKPLNDKAVLIERVWD